MENEFILIDMEAEVESFGRGVERSVDLVLSIVEPSFESMALAEKIVYLAEGLGINRAGALLIKVPSENIKEKMIKELEKRIFRPWETFILIKKCSRRDLKGDRRLIPKPMRRLKK